MVDALALLQGRPQRFQIGIAQAQRDAALVDHDGRPQAIRPIAPHRRGECLGEAEPAGVQGHADLGVATEAIELRDLFWRRDAAGDGDLGVARRGPNFLGEGEIGALQPALALDEGHQEAADQVAQLGDALQHAVAGALPPALDHDLAVAGVERGDDALLGQRVQHLGPGCGAEHHLQGAAIEPGGGAACVADAAAHPAWREFEQILDDGGVGAAAQGGVEVDHRDLADQAVALRERARIAGLERLLLAADQLDCLAALQIDRGNDHDRSITWFSC